ncbi:MAG: hypothetical protein ICV66_09835 [Chitinophagaceae bacterium]|nr:hypothetical protein [Chitinophagaceae bacterium]
MRVRFFDKINLDNENENIKKIYWMEQRFFEVLVRRYNSVLYKIGRTFDSNHYDTEDLMQEAYLSVFHE